MKSMNWKVMIQSDGRLKKAFPAPTMLCLKRGKNLGDLLIRAKLPKEVKRKGTRAGVGPTQGFKSCKAGRKSCSLCPFTGPAADRKGVVTKVTIFHSGMVLKLNQSLTCRDTYCLYILSCTKLECGQQYCGLSHRPLYKRFAEHLLDTQDSTSTHAVGKHWKEPGHTLQHLQFLPVEKLATRDRVTLREREKDLINRTGLLWAGLNRNR